jgi:hypothetical protein
MLGEAWVEVPVAFQFALAGPRTNPVIGDLMVAFSLPDAFPARLELFDIAGRRIAREEVGSLGAGNHVIPLRAGRKLPPGTYALRLTHRSRALVARVVVLR